MENITNRKFIFRTSVFIVTFALAIYNMELLKNIFNFNLVFFKVYHIFWLFLMLGMLKVCVPFFNNHVSCGKMFAKHFKENPGVYNENAAKNYTRKNNMGALRSGVLWFLLLCIIGFVYFTYIKNKIFIHLIIVFFYFSDEFCINIWCPFRTWIVRSKCCNSCRIFNWGHFMMFSPYIFIPSFYTYSLVIMSLFILVQWEYMHYRHPYRFSEISNLNLRCSNCLKTNCINTKSINKDSINNLLSKSI